MLNKIARNIELYADKNAFYINGKYFTYGALGGYITAIRSILQKKIDAKQEIIGIITDDSIKVYSAIFAVWFEQHIFLPINPTHPSERLQNIVDQTGVKFIISTSDDCFTWIKDNEVEVMNIQEVGMLYTDLSVPVHDPGDIMYILFTSGSTGIPKGVKITYGNLSSFVVNFLNIGYKLDVSDKFLQIYDLTFDASLHCYVVPLFIGGCIYTVPQNVVKYLYAYKLMQEHGLTFIKVPPSTLGYLRPYFNRIKLEKLKYCLLGGEALYADLVREWSKCVPGCLIQNVYGPTEATINCTYHNFDNRSDNVYNGVVSIGISFGDNDCIVVDREGQIAEKGVKGELCVAGSQVTPGYWKNETKNRESFLKINRDGKVQRYYRTGDLVFQNNLNNMMYCGRLDNQVQINGYRVELGEIENHARKCSGTHVAAVSARDKHDKLIIVLFMEGECTKEREVRKYLENHLPYYMLPGRIYTMKAFPLSPGGKINKSELTKIALQSITNE